MRDALRCAFFFAAVLRATVAIWPALHKARFDVTTGTCTEIEGFRATRAIRGPHEARCVLARKRMGASAAKTRSGTRRRDAAAVHFVGCAMDLVSPEAGASSWGNHGRLWPLSQQISAFGSAHGIYAVTVFEDPPRWITKEGRAFSAERLASDPSARMLLSWASSDARVRLLFGNGRLNATRTERLALCRNVLLRAALDPAPLIASASPAHLPPAHLPSRSPSPADLLVVVDLDCRPLLRPAAFYAAARAVLQGRWDVLAANTLPTYYDFWALRSTAFSMDYDCQEDRRAIRDRGFCVDWQIRLDDGAPIVPVQSAFGGLAVYRLRAVARTRCRYRGAADADAALACEHVSFHTCLTQQHGLRFGIDPALVGGCHGDIVPSNSAASLVKAHMHQLRLHRNGSLQTAWASKRPFASALFWPRSCISVDGAAEGGQRCLGLDNEAALAAMVQEQKSAESAKLKLLHSARLGGPGQQERPPQH